MKKYLVSSALLILLFFCFVPYLQNSTFDSTTKEFVNNETLNLMASHNEETVVYITKTGKKYHKGNCSYLKKSKITTTLEEACKAGYTPCSRCKPPSCPSCSTK